MAGTGRYEEVRESMPLGPWPVQTAAGLAGPMSVVPTRRRPPVGRLSGTTSPRHAGRVGTDDVQRDEKAGAGVALCVDGPMVGSEVTVTLGRHAFPPDVIDVDGHGYLLAVQARPVTGRPWRYTVIRPGDLWVIDGGGTSG